LPPGKSDAIYFDDKIPGFGVRLRAGGPQTWIYRLKFGPAQQRMGLGKVSAMKAGCGPQYRREASCRRQGR